MGHGCHDCGVPNGCECPDVVSARPRRVVTGTRHGRQCGWRLESCPDMGEHVAEEQTRIVAAAEKLREMGMPVPLSSIQESRPMPSMLTFASYSAAAMTTDKYPRVPAALAQVEGKLTTLPVYPALALGGEAGEFSEKVKKAWRDGTPFDRKAAANELGDCLWYITAAAAELGYTLQEIAQLNVNKLASRLERGVVGGSGDSR